MKQNKRWLTTALGLMLGVAFGFWCVNLKPPLSETTTAPAPPSTVAGEVKKAVSEKILGEEPLAIVPQREWATDWRALYLKNPEFTGEEHELGEFMRDWARADVAAAMQGALAATALSKRYQVVGIPLAVLAETDFPAVLQWLRTQPPSEFIGQQTTSVIMGELASRRPDLAVALIAAPGVAYNESFAGAILKDVAEKNLGLAMEGFRKLSPEAQNWATHAIAEGVAKTDVLAALKMVETVRTGPGFANGVARVLRVSSQSKPEMLLDYVRRYPELQGIAIVPVATGVIEQEPALAFALVNTLGDDEARSRQARMLANSFEYGAERMILGVYEAMPKAQADATVERAWRMWLSADAKAARATQDQISDLALRARLAAIKLGEELAEEN